MVRKKRLEETDGDLQALLWNHVPTKPSFGFWWMNRKVLLQIKC